LDIIKRVTVKNKIGTSKHPEKAGLNWKNFWLEHSTLKWPQKCQCCEKNNAEVGGHVFIAGETAKEYIVPMCSSCNGKPGAEFKNVDRDYLVEVNPE